MELEMKRWPSDLMQQSDMAKKLTAMQTIQNTLHAGKFCMLLSFAVKKNQN